MNTNPESNVQCPNPAGTQLGKVCLEGPQTIPSLWDVSVMLSSPTPLRKGSHAGKKSSTLSVLRQEQPSLPGKRNGRVFSELTEWDSQDFFFMPY
jgi:hypothetical protein